MGRDGRVVDGSRLESDRGLTPAGGSNPSLSEFDRVVESIMARRNAGSGIPVFLDEVILRQLLQPLVKDKTS